MTSGSATLSNEFSLGVRIIRWHSHAARSTSRRSITHSDLATTVSDVAKLLESGGSRVEPTQPNAQHLSRKSCVSANWSSPS